LWKYVNKASRFIYRVTLGRPIAKRFKFLDVKLNGSGAKIGSEGRNGHSKLLTSPIERFVDASNNAISTTSHEDKTIDQKTIMSLCGSDCGWHRGTGLVQYYPGSQTGSRGIGTALLCSAP